MILLAFVECSPVYSPLKAFIHDRKPRNLPRHIPKPIVQDVKEEFHSSSEEDGVAAQDQTAQELSSQASSAEPHTPSPQYSAARVHDSTFESTISTATPDPARQVASIPLDTGDSHLADLLSGLMRSAVSVPLEETSKPQATSAKVVPVPTPATHRHPAPTESPDWSARAPPKMSAATVQLSPAASPAVPTPQSYESTTLPSASSSIASSTTSPSLSTASGGGHTRRGSTADISPYLSHSRNIAKEMRYISILESVAQESDRTTSRMGHRSPMVAPSQPAYAPLPPPSVPPPSLDQSVIYSSPAPHMPRPQGQHPAYRAHAPDAFMVRPQTSHAYHPPPFPPSAIPRQSMNEHQLRALLPLNGPYHGSASSFAPPPMYPTPLQAPTSPMRAVPSPHFPAPHIGKCMHDAERTLVITKSSIVAHNNAIRATNNAQLLSILNAPSPGYRA